MLTYLCVCMCTHLYLHMQKSQIVVVVTYFVYLETIQIHNKILKNNLPPWRKDAQKMR